MMKFEGNVMMPYYWESPESMMQVQPVYMIVTDAQPNEFSFDTHPDMFMWEGGSEVVFGNTMAWLQPEADWQQEAEGAVYIEEQPEVKKTSRSQSSTPLTSDISTCDTTPSAPHGGSTIGKQFSSEARINWADVSDTRDDESDSESCPDWESAVREDPSATDINDASPDINDDPPTFDGTEASSERLREYLSKTLQQCPMNEPGAESTNPQPAEGEEDGKDVGFSEVADEEAAYRAAREAAAYHEAMLKSVLQVGIHVEATLEPNFWVQYLRS